MADQSYDSPLSTDGAPTTACALRSGRKRSRRRVVVWFGLAIVIVVVAAGTALHVALAQGPIGVDWLRPAIARALQGRFGAGSDVAIGAARIEQGRRGPTLMIDDLALRNGAGAAIIAAPRAELTISPFALLFGLVRPKSIELYGVEVRLAAKPDGALMISAGAEPIVLVRSLRAAPPDAAVPVDEPTPPQSSGFDPLKPVGAALAGLLDSVTGPDSGLDSLERMGVAGGRLVIEDSAAKAMRVFDDLEVGFDKTEGRARLRVSAKGSSGRWSLSLGAGEAVGDQRMLDVDAKDLSIDEVALAIGARDLPFSCDMPVSAQLRVGVDLQGALTTALGRFTLGAGYFVLDDPDHEPVLVDELSGAISFDDKSRTFALEPTQYLSGDSAFNVSGTIIAPSAAGEPWRVDGESAPGGVFGGERPGDRLVAIDKAQLSARLFPDQRKVVLDRIAVKGPEADLVATGETGVDDRGPYVKGHLDVRRTRLSNLLRLWPTFSDPDVRAFMLSRAAGGLAESGTLDFNFDASTVAGFRLHLPPPDAALRIDANLSDASIVLLPGMPPITGAAATLHVTGRTATISPASGVIEGANNHRLQLSDIVFSALENEKKPAPATATARVAGSIETLADLLGRDALKPFGGMQIDSATVKGQVDARVTVDLKLGDKAKPSDANVRATATIGALSIDKLIGKERFESGVLNVSVDAAGLKASGQGRLFGAAATIDLTKAQGASTDATVSFTVDDAARGRLGLNLGAGFSGPVGVRLGAQLGAKDPAQAQLELDLTRASIVNIPPGFSKPAGKPAKASLTAAQTPDGLQLDQIVFDIPGGPGLRGSVSLDAAGAFRSARLAQVRVSPGDDMKVDADQTKDGLRLVVRASEIDARPFVKALMDGSASKDAPSKDIDLELHSALVTGSNRQALSNVDLKLIRRGGWVRNFSLQAKSGRASVAGGMSRAGTEAAAVTLNSSDGGGLLSFIDLYKHMEGGRLQLTARVSDRGFNGNVQINDFLLRDEQALRRIVTEGVARVDASGAARIDTTAAQFSRLSASFMRGSGELVIRDGVLFSSQIGIKLDGTLDTARDRVDMSGVFVPAYGLNNLFSQLPVVGLILGGGAHEGLFAVNFRISGPASAPVLTLNPLSAIAPGFLRKIFGALDGTGLPPASGEPLPEMPLAIVPGAR